MRLRVPIVTPVALALFAAPYLTQCTSAVGPADANVCAIDAASRAPAGACDVMGMNACTAWARAQSTTITVLATCSDNACVPADRCSSNVDARTCTCGSNPRCGPGEWCVVTGLLDLPHCICATH